MWFNVAALGAAIVGTVVAGLKLRRGAAAWARDFAEVGASWVEVAVGPVVDGTRQAVDLTLRGGAGPHPLDQFNVDADQAALAGLEPPDDCVASGQASHSGRQVWTPRHHILLEPDVPRRFEFRFRGDAAPSVVGVRVAVPLNAGGGLLLFGLRMPLRDERARQAANLRSTLTTKARSRGVPANTLPEWPDLGRG